MIMNGPGELESVAGWGDPRTVFCLELQTKVREDLTIMEKAPNRAFSWLKAPCPL